MYNLLPLHLLPNATTDHICELCSFLLDFGGILNGGNMLRLAWTITGGYLKIDVCSLELDKVVGESLFGESIDCHLREREDLGDWSLAVRRGTGFLGWRSYRENDVDFTSSLSLGDVDGSRFGNFAGWWIGTFC